MAGIPGCRSRFLHQLGTGLFIILPPPPTFSMVIIYKISPFYLFTFCRAGNAKTPCPCDMYPQFWTPRIGGTYHCRSRQRKGVFMPSDGRGSACKKPYFFPPGVSVLNKKKEGRCTHIWCSCHLNLFQHLCIIFLLSGTRAFQMSLRRPIWDAFSFYRHSEGRCGMCRRGGPLSDGLHQSVTPSPYL